MLNERNPYVSRISYIMFDSKLCNSLVMIYVIKGVSLIYSNDVESMMTKDIESNCILMEENLLAYNVI